MSTLPKVRSLWPIGLAVLSILVVFHFTDLTTFYNSNDTTRVAYNLQRVFKTVDKLNSQIEQHADVQRLIDEAAQNAAKVFELSKEDARHEVSRQLWRLQETRSREEVERMKKESPRERVIDNSMKPNGSDIVLVWGVSSDYPDRMPAGMYDQMKQNRENYCQKHGYINFMANLDEYFDEDNKNVKKFWLKLYAMKDAFERYPDSEWFMWLDADIIIMEETIDLASHVLNPSAMKNQVYYNAPLATKSRRHNGDLTNSEEAFDPEKIELIACQDDWFLNVGVFLIKRTDFMINMINDKWLTKTNMDKTLRYPEQDCLNDLIIGDKEVRRRFASVPQSVLNAYHEGYHFEPSRWKEGDFIVHFPGESKKDIYKDSWAKYWNQKPELDDYNS